MSRQINCKVTAKGKILVDFCEMSMKPDVCRSRESFRCKYLVGTSISRKLYCNYRIPEEG